MSRKVVWPNSDGPTVKLMTVIEVAFLRGKGQDDSDPMRRVARYYAADDPTDLLWEYDPCADKKTEDPDANWDPRRTQSFP